VKEGVTVGAAVGATVAVADDVPVGVARTGVRVAVGVGVSEGRPGHAVALG
jgi:hypothetical protein